MTTLDDVQWQLVDVDAGSPRHKGSMAEIEPGQNGTDLSGQFT